MSNTLEKGLAFIRELDLVGGIKRNWIIRIEHEDTDPKYGYVPTERPVDIYIKKGLIILDKPPGPTSHEVVAWIKRMFNIDKAGHGGTLELNPL